MNLKKEISNILNGLDWNVGSTMTVNGPGEDLLVSLFRDWAMEAMMTSHRDGCAITKGEQTDSCDCTVEDFLIGFTQKIQESPENKAEREFEEKVSSR